MNSRCKHKTQVKTGCSEQMKSVGLNQWSTKGPHLKWFKLWQVLISAKKKTTKN